MVVIIWILYYYCTSDYEHEAYAAGSLSKGDFKNLLLLLNPVAPHMTEELWELTNMDEKPLHAQSWPTYDEAALVKSTVELGVQINGKVRARVVVPTTATPAEVEAIALADSTVVAQIDGATVKKVIVVPGRLVNIVVGK